MNTIDLITQLSRNTREVHIVEVENKPYLQLSVYSILTYADDYGYESYDDILEIKGLDAEVMETKGYEEAMIKREDAPSTLLEISKDCEYQSFETEGFLSLIKEEISLEDYYVKQNY